MKTATRWSHRAMLLVAPLAFSLCVGLPSAAYAASTAVTLGEVTTGVSRRQNDLPSLFRAELSSQLSHVNWPRIVPRDSFVLSARLVQLDTRTEGGRARSTCMISTVLRRSSNGSIHASVQGKARAEDAATMSYDNERSAMIAAIRTALRGISNAVQNAK